MKKILSEVGFASSNLRLLLIDVLCRKSLRSSNLRWVLVIDGFCRKSASPLPAYADFLKIMFINFFIALNGASS